jgi:hypothetical protein
VRIILALSHRGAKMTDRDLLETAGRHARAIAALDGQPPSTSSAIELYGLLRELDGDDRRLRVALIDRMLGLLPAMAAG